MHSLPLVCSNIMEAIKSRASLVRLQEIKPLLLAYVIYFSMIQQILVLLTDGEIPCDIISGLQ